MTLTDLSAEQLPVPVRRWSDSSGRWASLSRCGTRFSTPAACRASTENTGSVSLRPAPKMSPPRSRSGPASGRGVAGGGGRRVRRAGGRRARPSRLVDQHAQLTAVPWLAARREPRWRRLDEGADQAHAHARRRQRVRPPCSVAWLPVSRSSQPCTAKSITMKSLRIGLVARWSRSPSGPLPGARAPAVPCIGDGRCSLHVHGWRPPGGHMKVRGSRTSLRRRTPNMPALTTATRRPIAQGWFPGSE